MNSLQKNLFNFHFCLVKEYGSGYKMMDASS